MSLAFDNGSVGRVRELDGWRAVSVLFVILHHVVRYQHHRLVSHFYLPDHSIEYLGSLGVKIFFVISGFVICRLLILDVHPARLVYPHGHAFHPLSQNELSCPRGGCRAPPTPRGRTVTQWFVEVDQIWVTLSVPVTGTPRAPAVGSLRCKRNQKPL
jgi:hypothetical protein